MGSSNGGRDACAQPPPEEMAAAAGVKLPPLPWHLANIWWEFESPTVHFESLEMDVKIDRDVPATYNLYIAPCGVAQIDGLQFYGGLQSNINGWRNATNQNRVHPGKGAIFSRWSGDKKTPIGLDHVRVASPDSLVESAGYEGEFASVRRPLAWTKGTYTWQVRKCEVEVVEGRTNTWFACRVKDPAGTIHEIGSLRFEGADFTFWNRHSAFVEIYSTEKIPKSGIPKVNVTFGWPRLNGNKSSLQRAYAYYPSQKGPASPDCARVIATGENVRVEVGPIFQRDENQRRHDLALQHPGQLRIPAFTAYLEPDPESAQVSQGLGITGWKPDTKVLWFGEFRQPGQIQCSVALKLPSEKESRLRLSAAGQSRETSVKGGTNATVLARFGKFELPVAGYHRFTLESFNAALEEGGSLEALLLEGPAAQDAHFNLKPRRNAASVHLVYPIPDQSKVTAFYCEITGLEDPVWTYYMACGWHRGYFGMQVNAPDERRIIFSVWDSGNEAVDRAKVDAADRVTLMGKGEGVYAGDFGNEGTGGHSHLKYMWKTGQKQRFIVTAKPVDATHTVYSGYYFHPDKSQWVLISSWKAPKDGGYLRGLYSFSENFGGSNGHLVRKALFGNQWVRTASGEWLELTTATFSHDPTGRSDRLDRFMGIEQGQFFLSHGGFMECFTRFGEKFTRPAVGKAPVIELSE